ncbi:MAG: DUF1289 domain-containing protein [Pseudomonadota bacterium]
MTDPIWQRDEIESPCIRVCVIHPSSGLCLGCKRTGAEIASWSRMTPQARRDIMEALPSRPGEPVRQGGRRGRLRQRDP